jgi:hypothetical protein
MKSAPGTRPRAQSESRNVEGLGAERSGTQGTRPHLASSTPRS